MLEVNARPGLHHHYHVAGPPTPVACAILERVLRYSPGEVTAETLNWPP